MLLLFSLVLAADLVRVLVLLDEDEVDEQTAAPTTEDPPKKPLSDDAADEVKPTKQTSGVPGGSISLTPTKQAFRAARQVPELKSFVHHCSSPESDSEDLWSKARTPPTKPKAKAKSPVTLDEIFRSSKKYQAPVDRVASNLLVAATKLATSPPMIDPLAAASSTAASAATPSLDGSPRRTL